MITNRPHWCGIFVLLLVLSLHTLQASACPDIAVYEFYEALGCTPKRSEPVGGCVIEYDCSMVKKFSEDQCYRRGKIYDDGFLMPDDRTYCDFGCKCVSGGFSCPDVDCPYIFNSSIPDGCVPIYDGTCCERHIVCKADVKYTCTYGKQTYLPRQSIDMDERGCTVCKCREGFTGAVEASYCSRPGCKHDSGRVYYETLTDKCAPFYVVDHCCPVTTACADGTEVINKSISKPNGELTCKFGNHSITLSDEVVVKNPFPAVCRCIVPPLLTCNSELDFNTVGYTIRV